MAAKECMTQILEESAEELYENAPCGYLSLRPDGTISRVNQTFLNWTGYTRATLLSGTRFVELLTVPGRIFHETHYAPLLQMQGFVNEIAFDLRCANRDEPLPVLLNSVQVKDENGCPLLIRSTIFNATDRRRYEQELLRARREAEALRDGLVALTSSLDVQCVMEQILAYAATVVPSTAGRVILFEEGYGRTAYTRGFSSEEVAFLNHYRFPLNALITAGRPANAQPYLIADTERWSEWLPLPIATWVRSSIGVPIEVRGTVIGLLIADSANPDHFKVTDLEKLQLFARYVSLALENAHRVATLEERVAERTAALQIAKEQVDTILCNSGDGLLLVDAELRSQQANPAFQRLFGWSDNEWQGQSVLNIVPPRARAQLSAIFQAAQLGSSALATEVDAQRIDGTLFAAELVSGPTKDGGFVCTIRDITERKRAEAALQEQRDFLQLVIDNVPELIMIKDRAGRFHLVNAHAAQQYDMTPAEMVGKTDADLNPHVAQVAFYREKDQEALDRGQPILIPEELILNRYYQTSKIPLKQSVDQTERLLVVAFDITDRKNTELMLQQALQKEKELGELKSRFISMASHEFRTPLTAIRATADTLLLYRQKLPVEQIDKRLAKIQEQVSYLSGIIEDVLQLARLQARRVEHNPIGFDLQLLGHTIMDELASQFGGGRIVYHCDAALCAVTLDPKLMRQIMTNLISNALKYSPVTHPVYVDLTYQQAMLILQVRDEGIGIPVADLAHLYEPFHRAANVGVIAGTGLGLVITKESVELQGGTLHVTSQLGVGTTFTVCIPTTLSMPQTAEAYADAVDLQPT